MADDGAAALAGLDEAAPPERIPDDLTYVSPEGPGLRRRRSGRGFRYLDPSGAPVGDPATLERARRLAIPPAWTEVWICPDPTGHIQAVGFDAKGRRQYLYHPRFRAHRDEAKFQHITAFAEVLPALRARIAEDMAARGVGRAKVLATVAHLLETTMIRVGNAAYAKANGSFGLTTLRARHVKVEGSQLRFHFKGKSGKVWRLDVRDRRVARIVRACQELPGQHLFQYLDEEGGLRSVTSADVNAYLKAATGRAVTAKDFRTWFGTVLAAMALREAGPAPTKAAARKVLTRAIGQVAQRLGNTAAICRRSYVHPAVIEAYLDGRLAIEVGTAPQAREHDLTPEEAAVLAFLRDAAPA